MTTIRDTYARRMGGPNGTAAPPSRGYLLKVDRRLLDPTSGCGLMLARTPRYHRANAFQDIMRRYDCPNVFADKRAARILDGEETLMRQFCHRLNEFGVALQQNFQAVYAPCGIHLAIDPNQRAAYFMAEPESCLALRNYFRDALAGTLGQLGVAFKGSTSRLTPTGWHNLFELANNADFRYHVPPLRSIEVMAMATNARWHAPGLYLSASLLNVADAQSVAEEALKAITATPAPAPDLTYADAVASSALRLEASAPAAVQRMPTD
jgi:hypothetical protein